MKTGKLKRSFTPQDSIPKKGYFIIAVCSFLLVFLVWLLLTELGLVNEKFLPKPIETLQTGIRLFTENGFLQDIGVTTYRVLLGFLISMVVAVPLGILIGVYAPIEAFFEPVMSFLRYLPVTAFFIRMRGLLGQHHLLIVFSLAQIWNRIRAVAG